MKISMPERNENRNRENATNFLFMLHINNRILNKEGHFFVLLVFVKKNTVPTVTNMCR